MRLLKKSRSRSKRSSQKLGYIEHSKSLLLAMCEARSCRMKFLVSELERKQRASRLLSHNMYTPSRGNGSKHCGQRVTVFLNVMIPLPSVIQVPCNALNGNFLSVLPLVLGVKHKITVDQFSDTKLNYRPPHVIERQPVKI